MQSSAECLNELPLDYELAVGGVALNAMVMSDDVMAGDVAGGRDPGVRMVGLPQVLLDSEPLSQDTMPTDQSRCAKEISTMSSSSVVQGFVGNISTKRHAQMHIFRKSHGNSKLP